MDWRGYLGLDKIEIRAKSTMATDIAAGEHEKKDKKSFEEIVPHPYHDFRDVFAKESFDELPERRPWDHAIELIPGSRPIDCKVYPLSPDEQKELDAFLSSSSKRRMVDCDLYKIIAN